MEHPWDGEIANRTRTRIEEGSIRSLLLDVKFGEQSLGTATGFVVMANDKPFLITNRHVVTGRHQDTGLPIHTKGGIPDRLTIQHNRRRRLGRWIATTERLFSGDIPRWREHPTLGAKADFVALPLVNTVGVGFHPYDPSNPGPAISLSVTQAVSVVGFPFGFTVGGSMAIWATGFVASEPQVDYDGRPVMLIDCRTRKGQSGSPVVALREGFVAMEDGQNAMVSGKSERFVGVYSGRLNSDSDLGVVWKASAIAELIATLGSAIPAGSTRSKGQALVTAAFGESSHSISR